MKSFILDVLNKKLIMKSIVTKCFVSEFNGLTLEFGVAFILCLLCSELLRLTNEKITPSRTQTVVTCDKMFTLVFNHLS